MPLGLSTPLEPPRRGTSPYGKHLHLCTVVHVHLYVRSGDGDHGATRLPRVPGATVGASPTEDYLATLAHTPVTAATPTTTARAAEVPVAQGGGGHYPLSTSKHGALARPRGHLS